MEVYKAINRVTEALSKGGIGKDRRNNQQGFAYRGIDDVYNAIAPVLAREGLCMLPSVVSRELVERASAKGGALYYVTVVVDFDLVSSADGSKHTVRVVGEAMDSADKATNKAMSAAMKYACLISFQIPTEGDNDADASSPQPAPAAAPPRPFSAPPATAQQTTTALAASLFAGAKSVEELMTLAKNLPAEQKTDEVRAAFRAAQARLAGAK